VNVSTAFRVRKIEQGTIFVSREKDIVNVISLNALAGSYAQPVQHLRRLRQRLKLLLLLLLTVSTMMVLYAPFALMSTRA
jgi:hypothetical protein